MTKLPHEIIVKILYEFGGLQHPTSSIINDFVKKHFNGYYCFNCLNQLDYDLNDPEYCIWDISIYKPLFSVCHSKNININKINNIKKHFIYGKNTSLTLCNTCINSVVD